MVQKIVLSFLMILLLSFSLQSCAKIEVFKSYVAGLSEAACTKSKECNEEGFEELYADVAACKAAMTKKIKELYGSKYKDDDFVGCTKTDAEVCYKELKAQACPAEGGTIDFTAGHCKQC